MALKMEVYSPALELLGLLEIHRSVIWEEKAFSAGSFSLESLITEESRILLSPENIIWIEGGTAGIIEYVQQSAGESGPYISVKGRDLTGLLDRRILWGRYNMSGKVPDIMRRLVDDCCIHPTRGNTEARKMPGLVLLDTGTPDDLPSIRLQKTGGTLLEVLEELGETYQVSFGVQFNPEIPRLEFWARAGVNRSVHQSVYEPVFYSTELDDVLASEYAYDSGEYRNAALVAGEGEGDDRVVITVENLVEEEPDVPTPPDPPEPAVYTIALSVDPEGGGIAAGGGTVQAGSSVTVTAAPSAGYEFDGWRENGVTVSSSAAYTFTADRDRTLTAVFAAVIPTYVISANVEPSGSGTVSGGGTYQQGASVTMTAAAGEAYTFAAWKENGETVSTDASYTFTAGRNRSLTAVFEEIPTGGLPAGYTAVEYIQNGTSSTRSYMPYIKMPDRKTAVKFEIKFSTQQAAPTTDTKYYAVYGYNTVSSTGTVVRNANVFMHSGKVCWQSGITTINVVDYSAGVIYDAVFDKDTKTIVINGTSKTATIGTNWRTANNYLFGANNTSTNTKANENFAKETRVYLLKMWDADGNLVLDFVPCIDPAGVIGMYDTVGGVFYKNGNTSTNAANKFTAGPAV